jgi:hypothetical protein
VDAGTAPYSLGGLIWRCVELARMRAKKCRSSRLYAIHAGDGLAKIELVATILGLWGAGNQATVIANSSRPAMLPTIRSPLTTAATPAGVPV